MFTSEKFFSQFKVFCLENKVNLYSIVGELASGKTYSRILITKLFFDKQFLDKAYKEVVNRNQYFSFTTGYEKQYTELKIKDYHFKNNEDFFSSFFFYNNEEAQNILVDFFSKELKEAFNNKDKEYLLLISKHINLFFVSSEHVKVNERKTFNIYFNFVNKLDLTSNEKKNVMCLIPATNFKSLRYDEGTTDKFKMFFSEFISWFNKEDKKDIFLLKKFLIKNKAYLAGMQDQIEESIFCFFKDNQSDFLEIVNFFPSIKKNKVLFYNEEMNFQEKSTKKEIKINLEVDLSNYQDFFPNIKVKAIKEFDLLFSSIDKFFSSSISNISGKNVLVNSKNSDFKLSIDFFFDEKEYSDDFFIDLKKCYFKCLNVYLKECDKVAKNKSGGFPTTDLYTPLIEKYFIEKNIENKFVKDSKNIFSRF